MPEQTGPSPRSSAQSPGSTQWTTTVRAARAVSAATLLVGVPLGELARRSLVTAGDGATSWTGAWMTAAVALGVGLRGLIGERHERFAAALCLAAAAALGRHLDPWALSGVERLQSAVAGAASSTWLGLPMTALLCGWACLALAWMTRCALLGVLCPNARQAPAHVPLLARALSWSAFALQGTLWVLALLGYSSGAPVLISPTR